MKLKDKSIIGGESKFVDSRMEPYPNYLDDLKAERRKKYKNG